MTESQSPSATASSAPEDGISTKASHGHRIAALDGLRAVAILAVFFGHAYKVRMLWIGVDIFFVLSGFLITGILVDLSRKDTKSYFKHFYQRRARRILPPYILSTLVISLIFGFSWAHRWYMYFGLMNYVSYAQTFVPFNPLWSLAVEEQFYLVWPFIVYFAAKKRLPWIAIGLILLAPILRVLATPYDTWHWLIYKGTPFRMDLLATGALLTFVWRAHADKIKRFGYLGLIFPLLTPLIMMKLSRIGGFSTMDGTVRGNLFTYEIALFAATGTFLWALGGRFTWILKTFPMQWLGRISYTCYLMHSGALIWADERISRHGLAVAAAAIGILVYSLLSWFWMEKPILNAGNRRVARIEVQGAAA